MSTSFGVRGNRYPKQDGVFHLKSDKKKERPKEIAGRSDKWMKVHFFQLI